MVVSVGLFILLVVFYRFIGVCFGSGFILGLKLLLFLSLDFDPNFNLFSFFSIRL